MTKKKVTAPLTYDPGKGRPKEHLAYLNYQEMQALKRLNGNNMERGPRGLPSFPPADARGSSSRTSSTGARGPTGPQGQARTSPAGSAGGKAGSVSRTSTSPNRPSATQSSRSSGPSSSLSAPSRTAPSASISRPSDTGGRSTTSRIGSAASAQRSISRPSDTVGQKGSASVSRISGGVTGGNARDARVRQSLASIDASKASKTPALRQDQGRTINVGPMGSPVRVGVPSGRERRIVPRATVTTPMATQGASFRSPLEARIANRFVVTDAKLRSGSLGPEGVQSVSQIAAENARRLNAIKMAQQYAQYRSPPGSYPAAPQGVFGPRAGEGTGYLRTAMTPGMITTGMPSALSGMPGPRGNAEATLRAYEQEMRIANAKPITDRIPASKLYEERIPSEPRLSVGRSAVVPTTPPLRAEDGVYKRSSRDPAVERALAEAGFDPSGRRLQDLIDPSIPGRISVVSTRPRPDPALLRAYQGGFGPELMGAAGSEIERNLLARDPSRLAAYEGGFGPELMGAAGSELEKNLLSDYERAQSNLGRTRGLEAERILGVENLFSDAGIRKSISGYRTPKLFSDPINDRIMQSATSTPSSIVDRASDGSVVFKAADEIAPPPSISRGIEDLGDGVPAEVLPFSQIDPNTMRPRVSEAGISTISTPVTPPTPSMINMMRTAGPFATTIEDPESLRYKRASQVMGQMPRTRKPPDTDTAEGVPGPETPREDFVDDGSRSLSPSQELGAPSQDITLSPEAEEAQEETRKIAKTTRRGAQVVLNSVIPGAGTGAGFVLGALDRQVQKLVDAYQDAGMTERKAMEEKYPNLIPRAQAMGINSYYGMDKYQEWAEKSGLRGSSERRGEGGGNVSAGIASLGGEMTENGGPSAPEEPSTPSGRRPDIYYMWDLGVNIPSPSDPNYTQYQTYLAERLAAQRAMGYV